MDGRIESDGKKERFWAAIIDGTRKTTDLTLMCCNCHMKWHRGARKSIGSMFNDRRKRFFASLSNAEMSYPFSEDASDEIDEELDDEIWAIDYDFNWIEDYEDRRTSNIRWSNLASI